MTANTIFIETPSSFNVHGNSTLLIDNQSGNEYGSIEAGGILKLGVFNIHADQLVCGGQIFTSDVDTRFPDAPKPIKPTIRANILSCTGSTEIKNRIIDLDLALSSGGGTLFQNCEGSIAEVHGGIQASDSKLNIGLITSSSQMELNANPDSQQPIVVQDVYARGGVSIGDNVRIEGTLYVFGGGSVTGNAFIRHIKIFNGGLVMNSTNTEPMGTVEVSGGQFTYSGQGKPSISTINGNIILDGQDTVISSIEYQGTEGSQLPQILIDEDSNVIVDRIKIGGDTAKLVVSDRATITAKFASEVRELESTGTVNNITVNPDLSVSVDLAATEFPETPKALVITPMLDNISMIAY